MKVGYFQSHPEFGEVEKNLEQFALRLTGVDCELLVLPELAFSGYQFVSQDEVLNLSEPIPGGPTTQRCLDLARKHGMHLVVGLPEREGERCYNSAIVVGPSGFIGSSVKHIYFLKKLCFLLLGIQACMFGISGRHGLE